MAFTLAFYLLRKDHKIARWFRQSFENQPSVVLVVFIHFVRDVLPVLLGSKTATT